MSRGSTVRRFLTPSIVTAAVVAVLIVAGLIFFLVQQTRTSDSPTAELVRGNSHVLDDGGPAAVTVVEFLDFECEACGAFYPIVEDLRETHAGDITYVVRHFPLPGHVNSTNAALAAEAAAQQGRFEDMYHRLFETQSDWGEAQVSHATLFRQYAADLGLDLSAYDAAIADPATLDRVEADAADARTLGAHSTPSFFIDGQPVTLERWDDLETAVAGAVAD